ncbi:LysR family transcriptional regulator [Puniceicoccus vermicola]|uniref:LysR family transcriptional regulator n=1 Tax=Puniceicoccus vermicola TaxID=388746 RepID=A0A7X1AVZ5_9BACT|nr:LysR family transcriptional regulator [Puniceicoccus vermicola]MBC2600857.1 LysR family transcriptional regulator [Puniceicoccus vermicola]
MCVDIQQLRIFCSVAGEENLTRAAEKLHLSAPSVSARIKALEEFLEVQLFVRSARGMFLTEAGHALWQEAEGILSRVDQLRDRVRTSDDAVSGTIRLAINNPPEVIRFDALLKALVAQYPNLNLETSFGNSVENLRKLLGEQVDFCFFEGPIENANLEAIPLTRQELILVAPAKWEIDWAEVLPQALEEHPWIFMSEGCSCFTAAKNWAAGHGLRLKSQIRNCPNDLTTLSYVAGGMGVSVISRKALELYHDRKSIAIVPCFSESVLLSFVFRKGTEGYRRGAVVIDEVCRVWGLEEAP